jgi:hypothetical protein
VREAARMAVSVADGCPAKWVWKSNMVRSMGHCVYVYDDAESDIVVYQLWQLWDGT